MKPAVIPMTCALALASMSAAALSHWWSLGAFATALNSMPRPLPVAAPIVPAPIALPVPVATVAVAAVPVGPVAAVPPTKAAPPAPAQQEFFEALLDEMKQIKRENTAMRDQMAETNRDLMKLEFRVDTHSESFRPLPTTENDATVEPPIVDDGPGVLPPRPAIVGIPTTE